MDAAIARVLEGRGGVHQRLQFSGGQPGDNIAKSVFAERILLLWSWGVVSATTVQWLSEGCKLDGQCSDLTRILAGMGTAGEHPGNCRQDVLRRVVAPRGVSIQTMQVEIPILDMGRIIMSTQSIISPIQIVELMYRDYNSLFVELFGIRDLERFGDSQRADDPTFLDHPMLGKDNWRKRAIPVLLHGDGARFTCNEKNSLMVTSWKPLLNPRF